MYLVKKRSLVLALWILFSDYSFWMVLFDVRSQSPLVGRLATFEWKLSAGDGSLPLPLFRVPETILYRLVTQSYNRLRYVLSFGSNVGVVWGS
jgi:hypothetical protein